MNVRLYAPGAPTLAPRRLTVDEDEIEVICDGPARIVAGPGRPRRLHLVDLGSSSVRELRVDRSALIYADRFSQDDVEVVQRQRWSGIDRTGQLVISSRNLDVVVRRSGVAPANRSDDYDLIPRLRARRELEDRSGIRGAATARLAQLLLEEPARVWRPTELADRDGQAAPATASRLLAELAVLGLVASTGRSRTHDYVVVDQHFLALWLAEQSRPPNPAQTLSCYVRAQDPFDLVAHLSQGAVKVRSRYAAVLTGSAAALVDGALVTTRLVTAPVRIQPDIALAAAADDFDARPVSTGANVRFIRDVGSVGTLHQRDVAGAPTASRIRTWLDLRSEPRGLDAADLYWRQVIDRKSGVIS